MPEFGTTKGAPAPIPPRTASTIPISGACSSRSRTPPLARLSSAAFRRTPLSLLSTTPQVPPIVGTPRSTGRLAVFNTATVVSPTATTPHLGLPTAATASTQRTAPSGSSACTTTPPPSLRATSAIPTIPPRRPPTPRSTSTPATTLPRILGSASPKATPRPRPSTSRTAGGRARADLRPSPSRTRRRWGSQASPRAFRAPTAACVCPGLTRSPRMWC